MVSKELEQEIKFFMAERLSQGESLSDIQKEVNAKFNVRYTYMDIRILASSLDVDWKARNPQPAAPAEEEKTEEAATEATAPQAGDGGTVKFANGSTGDWYLDQTGRLGLDNLVGEKPGQDDIVAFQQELQRQLGA